jgi:UDP-N-acetylglucosamine diphosphorylase/glucosamine-1-phosphate N-acetyltransferase
MPNTIISGAKEDKHLLSFDAKFGRIILFEDTIARSRSFLPLTYLRSTHELRTGGFTQLERVQRIAGNLTITLHVSDALKEVTAERHDIPTSWSTRGKALLLNSRTILDDALIVEINKLEIGSAIKNDGVIVASFVERAPDASFSNVDSLISGKSKSKGKTYQGIWELVSNNAVSIDADAGLLRGEMQLFSELATGYTGVHAISADNILVSKGVQIAPGVVLDASEGPIVLMVGATIMANAVIMGPAVIGEKSLIKIGAKIYHGTSIGPMCKIGGEVEKSIVLGYSNKQHDGYLGHSYLGEWVNLGADTNTSDLKNDYSNVKLTIEGEEFETHTLFAGLFIGDHSKTAINSQFNTGSVVGVNCNIFDSGFPSKWIRSFSWVGGGETKNYEIGKAISVAKTVIKRRNKKLSKAEEALLRSVATRT